MSELKEETDINTLKLSCEDKKSQIIKFKIQIKQLEEEISTIRKEIVDNCQHNWVYEPPAIYERSYYYCSECRMCK